MPPLEAKDSVGYRSLRIFHSLYDCVKTPSSPGWHETPYLEPTQPQSAVTGQERRDEGFPGQTQTYISRKETQLIMFFCTPVVSSSIQRCQIKPYNNESPLFFATKEKQFEVCSLRCQPPVVLLRNIIIHFRGFGRRRRRRRWLVPIRVGMTHDCIIVRVRFRGGSG